MATFIKLAPGALGNDPAQLREFGSFLEGPSTSDLQDLFNRIDQRISATTWAGLDATKFEGQWEALARQTISNITSLFQDTAATARANADQQESASQ
jgi:hypothetical protein